MMEQADAREGHGDVVFVAGFDDMVVAHRSAGLGHESYAAFVGTFDVVAKGEEGVRAERYALVEGYPFLLLFAGEHFGFFGEELLPLAVAQDIHVVVRDIDVDGVVAVSTADLLYPRQVHHLGVLTEPPDVGLVACESGAVDAALLSGADTDSLAVLDVADGVALSVFECDEGDAEVALGGFGERLVACGDIVEEVVARKVDFVASLFEGDAIDLLVLDGGRAIVGINAEHDVGALAFLAEDGERLVRVSRCDDTVAHFALDEKGGCLVAGITEGDEVAVRRHAVGTAGAGIGGGDGREGFSDIVDEVNLAECIAQWQAHGGAGGRNVLE